MQEQTQTTRTQTTTGGGLGGPFDNNSPFAPTVTVRHGVHTERTHANQTVGEVRERMRDRLGLSDEATAFVDGREVDADTRIIPGQTLTFMRKAGEKGASSLNVPAKVIIAHGSDFTEDTVNVRYDMFMLSVKTDGATVAEFRKQFRKQLAIPDQSHAVLEGELVDEDAFVLPGQSLRFIKPSGALN